MTVKEALKHPDKTGAGAAKRRKLRTEAQVWQAIEAEFKRGTLRSGSGHKVIKRSQMKAIGVSETKRFK